jgi:monoterpene epsilon-lactone hydrolase
VASREYEQILELAWARRRDLYAELPLSVERGRAELEETAALFPLPDDVEVEAVDADGVPALWLTPPGASDKRTILYSHGGYYQRGSPATHQELAARIARAASARALAIDYRLAPEHPHPAAVDDAVTAYSWLLGQGPSPEEVALAGDSAGGGLTMAALVAMRDRSVPLPAAVAVLSPWVDLALTGESIAERQAVDPVLDLATKRQAVANYLDGGDPKAPLASPLYADLSGLPPLLIQVGTDEILYDDSKRLAAAAEQAGVEVTLEVGEGMIHVFQFVAVVPEAQAATDRIGRFFAERLG